MVTLKKKVTIRVKTPSETSSLATPTTPPLQPTDSVLAKRKSQWWLWLLALVAVVVAVICFCHKPQENGAVDPQPVVVGDEPVADEQVITNNLEENEAEKPEESNAAEQTAEGTDTPTVQEETVPVQPVAASPQEEEVVKAPQRRSIDGSVEENALRAIRGDFGNGQERKDKLGDRYTDVQRRVNEMYRSGLVN